MPITRAYAQAAEPGNFFVAGKNKIINGDFNINQRGFSSTSTPDQYGFDRWIAAFSGATATYSAQTFTLGSAPVAGYESKNFARLAVTTGNDFCRLEQKIEDVRTFAGQTVTVSFWAKGTNPTTAGNLTAATTQYFGTGGSPSSTVRTVAGTFVLTANWTRYSLTVAVPSISGKTLGSDNNSSFIISFGQEASTSTDAWTLDIWGVQVEAGSVATPFTTATGTLAGELAACQRYYIRYGGNVVDEFFGWGHGNGSTQVYCRNPLPVTMRTTPTFGSAAIANFTLQNGSSTTTALTSVAISGAANKNFAAFNFTKTGATFTGGQMFGSYADNTLNAYLEWSAEL